MWTKDQCSNDDDKDGYANLLERLDNEDARCYTCIRVHHTRQGPASVKSTLRQESEGS